MTASPIVSVFHRDRLVAVVVEGEALPPAVLEIGVRPRDVLAASCGERPSWSHQGMVLLERAGALAPPREGVEL